LIIFAPSQTISPARPIHAGTTFTEGFMLAAPAAPLAAPEPELPSPVPFPFAALLEPPFPLALESDAESPDAASEPPLLAAPLPAELGFVVPAVPVFIGAPVDIPLGPPSAAV
jgi:hypothetical protein